MLMAATETLSVAVGVGVLPAWESMGVARSTLYYQRQTKQAPKLRPRPAHSLVKKDKESLMSCTLISLWANPLERFG